MNIFRFLRFVFSFCMFSFIMPSASLFTGRKEVVRDGTSEKWDGGNSTININLGRYVNKRALAHIFLVRGQVKVTLPTANSATQSAQGVLKWADDYIYKIFQSFQIVLNGTIQVKDCPDLTFFRYWNALYNRGKFPMENVPTDFTIGNNEQTTTIDFEVPILVPYAIYDMLGAPQCNIPTWIWNTFQMVARNANQTSMLSESAQVTITNTPATGNPTTTSATASVALQNVNVSAYVKNFITDMPKGNAQEILAGLGSLLVTKYTSKNFAGGGVGQYIELPNNIWAAHYTIVLRDSETRARIPLSVLDNIRFANGDFVLADSAPTILINDLIQRFSLSRSLWAESLADSPDGKGILCGVLTLYTNYFGDMNNSLVYRELRQPRIIFDFNNKLSQYLSQGAELLVEVYSSYIEVPQTFNTLANALAQEQAERENRV